MRVLRGPRTPQAGFTLIEVIVSIVLASIVGVIFLTYMGTQLTHSGDPVNVARDEGVAEMWMERIMSDYVQEMNAATLYNGAGNHLRPGLYGRALQHAGQRDADPDLRHLRRGGERSRRHGRRNEQTISRSPSGPEGTV